MDELRLEDLNPAQEAQAPALIQVAQLPIIIQHLEEKSRQISEKTAWAMTLAVSPETLTDVRKVKADLNHDKEELEAQRKAVKAAIMAPYDEFEALYKKYIKDPFDAAEKDLGSKIKNVEAGIIGDCQKEMQEYFTELIRAKSLEWLKFEQLGIKIGLTDAKQKTHKRLREAISCNVTAIAEDVATIAGNEDAAEVMAEYKQCLCLGQALRTVRDRHQRIEDEQKRREAWEAQQAARREAMAKVEAAAPAPTPIPTAAPAPAPVAAPDAPENVYRLNFSICGTKPKLVEFKKMLIEYCKKEGLEL